MHRYTTLAVGVVAGLVVGGATLAPSQAETPCQEGAADAVEALTRYDAIVEHYQDGNRILYRSAQAHGGRPTRPAMGKWFYIRREADAAASTIKVQPVIDKLETC